MEKSITIDFLKQKGFKEVYNNHLGAAHYKKENDKNWKDSIEIRHVEDNNRFWITNGKSCYELLRELFYESEVNSLIDFYCFN